MKHHGEILYFYSMSQEFLEIWAEVSFIPGHFRRRELILLCSRSFWKFGQRFPSIRTIPGPALFRNINAEWFARRLVWVGLGPVGQFYWARRLVLLSPTARFVEPCIKGWLPVGILHWGLKLHKVCACCRIRFLAAVLLAVLGSSKLLSVSIVSYCAIVVWWSFTDGFPSPISYGWVITLRFRGLQMSALLDPSAAGSLPWDPWSQ